METVTVCCSRKYYDDFMKPLAAHFAVQMDYNVLIPFDFEKSLKFEGLVDYDKKAYRINALAHSIHWDKIARSDGILALISYPVGEDVLNEIRYAMFLGKKLYVMPISGFGCIALPDPFLDVEMKYILMNSGYVMTEYEQYEIDDIAADMPRTFFEIKYAKNGTDVVVPGVSSETVAELSEFQSLKGDEE